MISPLRLYLIRHGRPGAGFAEAVDPGLDEIGREQARTIAEELSSLGPLSLITSPLKRAREKTTGAQRIHTPRLGGAPPRRRAGRD